MDSDNSISIQSSSSGGDDHEYDSRATDSSFSSLFNSPGPVGAFDNAPLLQLYSLDAKSNSYLNNQQHHRLQLQQPEEGNNNNNLLVTQNHNNNQDMVWAHKFDMNPSCTQPGPVGYPIGNHTTTNLATPHQASPLLPSPSGPTNQDGPGPGPIRNPKKRSRASRRAPTTVLATDTTNFRQMVQEFTGIPAPPFSTSGFTTSRGTRLDLDLFSGMGMGMGMGMGLGLGLLSRENSTKSSLIDVTTSSSSLGVAQQHPRYLLRPFPQKILPQQHKQNSISTPTTMTTSSLVDAPVTQSCILPFQPLLQTPSSLSPLLALIHHDSSQVNIGSKTGLGSSPMDQFGFTHCPAPSPPPPPTTANATKQILQGGGDGGFGQGPQGNSTNSCTIANNQYTLNWVTHDQLLQQNSAMNETLEDHGGSVRGEGMVNSWICSSD